MASTHKTVKPLKPAGFRLTDDDKRAAKRAAQIESRRTGRRIGWTTLIADGGMAKVRRILRRAEKAEAQAVTA